MNANRNSGFTLLEVIIAVTILAFISLFTTRMIQQGIKAKGKIQAEIDRTSGLIAALQLMSRDVENAFNYRDINVELFNAAQKQRREQKTAPKKNKATGESGAGGAGGTSGGDTAGTPPLTGGLSPQDEEKYKLKEVKIYTRFIGEGERLDFTSLSNFRSVKNSAQSDQAEIGYYLENCSSRVREESSQCLWRRTSPYLDEEIREGGKSTVLLENVKSLKFRYLPEKEEKWVESWNSVNGEEIMKNKFPVAVEINLTVLDTKFNPPKEIAMTVVAALRFPNNKPDEKSTPVN